MDIEAAAEKTLMLARDRADTCSQFDIPGLTLSHIEDMWARWPHEGSPTKRCRWLGWMQAAVVAMTAGDVTLEDMKQINISCADEPVDESDPREAMIAAVADALKANFAGKDIDPSLAAELAVDAVLAKQKLP